MKSVLISILFTLSTGLMVYALELNGIMQLDINSFGIGMIYGVVINLIFETY